MELLREEVLLFSGLHYSDIIQLNGDIFSVWISTNFMIILVPYSRNILDWQIVKTNGYFSRNSK